MRTKLGFKSGLLVLTALIVVSFVLLSGCAGEKREAVYFAGNEYLPSGDAVLSGEELYYTGCDAGSSGIYVRHTGMPEKLPSGIVLKDDKGGYDTYGISVKNQSIHAYSLYDTYGVNETVIFGITTGDDIELMDSAPWEIQKKEGDEWTTVVNHGALMMITPVKSGSFKEWMWDQRLDDGSSAPAGEYRVVVNSSYRPPFTATATFNISDRVPGIYVSSAKFDNSSVDKMFSDISRYGGLKEHHVFEAPLNYTSDIRDRTISLLQYKAWKKGLDPDGLRAAIRAADNYAEANPDMPGNTLRMPSSATHADFEGRPAWIVVFDWEVLDTESQSSTEATLGHVMIFVVDDASGKVVYFNSCR